MPTATKHPAAREAERVEEQLEQIFNTYKPTPEDPLPQDVWEEVLELRKWVVSLRAEASGKD